MSATPAPVQPGEQVAWHLEGAHAAERFVQNLERFLCTGTELCELLALSSIMPAGKRGPWQRGFGNALQKTLQRALDAKP